MHYFQAYVYIMTLVIVYVALPVFTPVAGSIHFFHFIRARVILWSNSIGNM